MPDRFSDRSPDQRPTTTSARTRRSRHSGARPGSARRSSAPATATVEHFWECIISDGTQWHFIRVLGVDLPPAPGLGTEDIEHGIEAFAGTLPESNRVDALLNANPLHVDRSGTVGA